MARNQWSQKARAAIEPVFQRITAHPFITGLVDGGLEPEKFLFYLGQDALYLDDFGKVLAGLAVRSPGRPQTETFLRFAGDTIAVERELHRAFLGGAEPARPTPTCLLYTSFLHRQLAVADLETAVAAVLPCFWIYQEVGAFILARAKRRGHPYQRWIDTYGGEAYARAVQAARGMADHLAEAASSAARARMTEAFVLASKMEWMFWDAAWRLEAWPV